MACEAPYHHLQLPHTTNYSLACLAAYAVAIHTNGLEGLEKE
jgi:hypothetical protein